jgi:hydrogenase expression/formation protein HypC
MDQHELTERYPNMCLAVPGKIIRVTGSADAPTGRVATVDFHGTQVEVSLAITLEAREGDWVLVHAGYAIAVLDEAQAQETWACLQELQELQEPGETPA